MYSGLRPAHKKTHASTEDARAYLHILVNALDRLDRNVFYEPELTIASIQEAWIESGGAHEWNFPLLTHDATMDMLRDTSLFILAPANFSRETHILSCVSKDLDRYEWCEKRNPRHNNDRFEYALFVRNKDGTRGDPFFVTGCGNAVKQAESVVSNNNVENILGDMFERRLPDTLAVSLANNDVRIYMPVKKNITEHIPYKKLSRPRMVFGISESPEAEQNIASGGIVYAYDTIKNVTHHIDTIKNTSYVYDTPPTKPGIDPYQGYTASRSSGNISISIVNTITNTNTQNQSQSQGSQQKGFVTGPTSGSIASFDTTQDAHNNTVQDGFDNIAPAVTFINPQPIIMQTPIVQPIWNTWQQPMWNQWGNSWNIWQQPLWNNGCLSGFNTGQQPVWNNWWGGGFGSQYTAWHQRPWSPWNTWNNVCF